MNGKRRKKSNRNGTGSKIYGVIQLKIRYTEETVIPRSVKFGFILKWASRKCRGLA